MWNTKNVSKNKGNFNNQVKVKLLKWQKDVINQIKNNRDKNIIITAPTGSGKSLIGYWFGGLLKQVKTPNGSYYTFRKRPFKKVIFTYPIKALVNDKYRELKESGLNPTILTGDIKRYGDRNIILATHEEYLQLVEQRKKKNLEDESYIVIVDEFHYIFQAPNRALNYLKSFNSQDEYLFLSATIKITDELLDYLTELTGRETIYITSEYLKEFQPKLSIEEKPFTDYKKMVDVLNSPSKKGITLHITFSRKSINSIGSALEQNEEILPIKTLMEIETLKQKYKITLTKDEENMLRKGIVIYYGKLPYTKKLFFEELAKKEFIQHFVSTDAVSLGVNFPIRKVVFHMLKKFDGRTFRPLLPSEFKQIIGRAGRKPYYEDGYVYSVDKSIDQDRKKETYKIYKELINKDLEDPKIDLDVNLKQIYLLNKELIENGFIETIKNSENKKEKISEIKEIISGYIRGLYWWIDEIIDDENYENYLVRIEKDDDGKEKLKISLLDWDLTKDNIHFSNIENETLEYYGKLLEKYLNNSFHYMFNEIFKYKFPQPLSERRIIEILRVNGDKSLEVNRAIFYTTINLLNFLRFILENYVESGDKFIKIFENVIIPIEEINLPLLGSDLFTFNFFKTEEQLKKIINSINVIVDENKDINTKYEFLEDLVYLFYEKYEVFSYTITLKILKKLKKLGFSIDEKLFEFILEKIKEKDYMLYKLLTGKE